MRPAAELTAVERARWLAELASALTEARALVKALGAAEGRMEAMELYAHIEALRLEVDSLRLRNSAAPGEEIGPKWSHIPWDRSGAWD